MSNSTKSTFAHIISLFFSVSFVLILATIIYVILVNSKTEEIFKCDRNQNICTYQYIKYNNPTPVLQRLFAVSDMRDIKSETKSEIRGSGKNRRRVTTYHVYIQVQNGMLIKYPIKINSFSDYNAKQLNLKRFLLENQSLYYDKKTTDVKKFLVLEYIVVGGILILIFAAPPKRRKETLKQFNPSADILPQGNQYPVNTSGSTFPKRNQSPIVRR